MKIMKRINVYFLSNFLVAFGFAVWQVLFNNFAVEKFNVDATHIGLAQSLREIPGLLVFTVSFFALVLSEIKIASLTVILMGIGVVLCGYAQTYNLLLAATFIMSIGFHYCYAIQQSAGTKIFDSQKTAHFFSIQRSLGALSAVLATILCFLFLFKFEGTLEPSVNNAIKIIGILITIAGIYILFKGPIFNIKKYMGGIIALLPLTVYILISYKLEYETVFKTIGIAIIILGAYIFIKSPGKCKPVKPPRIKLHKSYFVYYCIHFLMGLRRHIFTTFAIFLLVKIHNVNIKYIIMIIFSANVIGIVLFRYYGHIINFLGGKNTLRLEFFLLIFIFLCYAFINNVKILALLYAFDFLLFGLNSSVDVYLKSIVKDRYDSSMTVSAGFAINHITAVVIPVVGGYLWDTFSFQIPFILGSVIAVFSVAFISMDKQILKFIRAK